MEYATAKTVDRSQLKDIRDVVIDTSKSCEERIQGWMTEL